MDVIEILLIIIAAFLFVPIFIWFSLFSFFSHSCSTQSEDAVISTVLAILSILVFAGICVGVK